MDQYYEIILKTEDIEYKKTFIGVDMANPTEQDFRALALGYGFIDEYEQTYDIFSASKEPALFVEEAWKIVIANVHGRHGEEIKNLKFKIIKKGLLFVEAVFEFLDWGEKLIIQADELSIYLQEVKNSFRCNGFKIETIDKSSGSIYVRFFDIEKDRIEAIYEHLHEIKKQEYEKYCEVVGGIFSRACNTTSKTALANAILKEIVSSHLAVQDIVFNVLLCIIKGFTEIKFVDDRNEYVVRQAKTLIEWFENKYYKIRE